MRSLPEFEQSPDYKELMDCGKRIADIFIMHRMADPYGVIGQFFAVRLADGRTNEGNPLYPSMDAAREHVRKFDDEDRWMYVQIVPAQLPARDAAILLKVQRRMFEMGIRVSSMNGRTVIPRLSREDNAAQNRSIFRGTAPRNIRFPR
jgi:hypothetical protein